MDNGDSFISSITIIKKKKNCLIDLPIRKRKKKCYLSLIKCYCLGNFWLFSVFKVILDILCVFW